MVLITLDDFESGFDPDWVGDTGSFSIDTTLNLFGPGTGSSLRLPTGNGTIFRNDINILRTSNIGSPTVRSLVKTTGRYIGVLFGGTSGNNCYVAQTQGAPATTTVINLLKIVNGTKTSFASKNLGVTNGSAFEVIWTTDGSIVFTWFNDTGFASAKGSVVAVDNTYISGGLGVYGVESIAEARRWDNIQVNTDIVISKYPIFMGDSFGGTFNVYG